MKPAKKNHKDIVRFLTELEAFASIHAYDGDRLVFDPSEIFKFPIPVYTGKIDTTVSFPTLLKLYNDTMNTHRVVKPNGSHMTMPGSSPDFMWRDHQMVP